MKNQEFDIKMEKISDAPDKTSSKYAIIGYFRSKQQETAKLESTSKSADVNMQHVVSVASKQTIDNTSDISVKKESKHRSFCVFSKSTAEQWLLALIAFLLFIHLLCKS